MIDVCNVLGKSLKSRAWSNLENQVGDIVKEENGNTIRSTYFSFKAGLHLEYDLKESKFEGAWIYFTEKSGYGQYTGVLPFGLMCDDDRETVQSKLSKPPSQTGFYKRPLPMEGQTNDEFIQYMEQEINDPPTMTWDSYLEEPYSLLFYFDILKPFKLTFMHLSLTTDGGRKYALVKDAARDGQYEKAAELLLDLLNSSNRSFSYSTHLEIAELFEQAGNIGFADKHYELAVENGVRETYGACKQKLLLQHAEFNERQGNQRQALRLLALAHEDSKKRKSYLSKKIGSKLATLVKNLNISAEELADLVKAEI